MDTYKKITNHFAELSVALISVDRVEVEKAVALLRVAKSKGASVYIMGNGGSAATASHFANDLVKIAGVKAFSLPDMTPTMMAYGNDNGWQYMFSHMLNLLQNPDDVIVAISCSGNSLNVVQAAYGVENLIILTGNEFENNKLAHIKAKAIIPAMNDDITIQEDIHTAVCHAIAKALEE